jgi:aryl-alcohol dehydrogenase-like predicted oxidoreductase
MTPNKRRLGKADLEITTVGFGAQFTEPYLSRNLALRDALRPVAERHGVTVSAVAVAWTLVCPGVTGAIVGTRSPEQVDGWIAAGSLDLDAYDLERISGAIRMTAAGTGPVACASRRAA